jgi:DTW domain-containing protein
MQMPEKGDETYFVFLGALAEKQSVKFSLSCALASTVTRARIGLGPLHIDSFICAGLIAAHMARSVVLQGGPRCEGCRQPPRWCICNEAPPLELPVAVEVLQHSNEVHKPTSTGSLILRTVANARGHVYERGKSLDFSQLALPGRELWFLHPNGGAVDALPPPANLQVVLLDASWSQARLLERACDGKGRRVALPMSGESRYWLRTQNAADRFSTIEALIFLLSALGCALEAERLGCELERHVYAGLRARGRLAASRDYLATSHYAESLAKIAGKQIGRDVALSDESPEINA